MRKEDAVYQFKITLKDVTPPLWRRFLVEPQITLRDLHLVIMAVMGWSNYHLHEFTINGVRFGGPAMDEEWSDLPKDLLDEGKFKVSQAINPEGQTFEHSYDFGDGWEHEVVMEQIILKAKDATYPMCIGGARCCPPEDCGGPWGYKDLLKIIKNPKHPRYSEKKVWLGRFDSERFDVAEINTALRDDISKQLSRYRPKRKRRRNRAESARVS